MAALPQNNIYPALVANTIDEPSTDVGTLVLSYRVNRWGFNSPDPVQQAKYWGIATPPPYHELGAFRRYDHAWRCYTIYNIEIGGAFENYSSGYLGFIIGAFPYPSDAPAAGTVPHVFDIWMNRWADNWVDGQGKILIADNFTINESDRRKIDIDPLDPPDGFGPLPKNSTIYFLLIRRASTAPEYDERWGSDGKDRRWDSRAFAPVTPIGGQGTIAKDPDGNYDGWRISIAIGATP